MKSEIGLENEPDFAVPKKSWDGEWPLVEA